MSIGVHRDLESRLVRQTTRLAFYLEMAVSPFFGPSAPPYQRDIAETISPINRARRVARQTGSRFCTREHLTATRGEPAARHSRMPDCPVKVLRPVLRKTRAKLHRARDSVARARLHGKSRNRPDRGHLSARISPLGRRTCFRRRWGTALPLPPSLPPPSTGDSTAA